MWSYGFFNSVNGDRVYNAQQMSEIFEGLITDGVYESVGDKLAVQPSSGMTIQIGSGRGWFNKHWVNNDTAYLMTLEEADVTLNRYAAVCIRVDDTDSVRTAEPYIKYGEYATTPVKPTMTRTSTVNEYCLAYVYIKGGVTAITSANIEDTRADESLCGWVTGLIEQLNSATLFEQFTGIFNDWFDNLADNINENTEAVLVAALPTSVTVTLLASGWTNNTQTVTVTGMNDTKSVMVSSNSEYGIECTAQGTNSLTFTCGVTPVTDVTVDIVHMGK